ncbi:MAG: bacteriohemerythrin [Desulfovibrio sp.]|nr:bacteriohemerythrin [Desulfovibrio sp.]
MPIIQWSEDMNVGLEPLDEQHKDLVLLMDAAYRAALDDTGRTDDLRVQALIRDMRDYALDHFTLEEEYMRRIGYPRREEHAFLHKEFVRRVSEIERPDSLRDRRVDVFLFLADWLRTHILREDMEFGDYARSLPVDSSSKR